MLNPPDQQAYPQTAINITNEGMVISVQLAPGMAFSQLIPVEMMSQIVAKWTEIEGKRKNELAIIDLVQRSKNR